MFLEYSEKHWQNVPYMNLRIFSASSMTTNHSYKEYNENDKEKVWMDFLSFLTMRKAKMPKTASEITRMSQKFCNILEHTSLWHVYHMTEAVQVVEDIVVHDIIIVGILRHALFHCMYDLNAALMCNVV